MTTSAYGETMVLALLQKLKAIVDVLMRARGTSGGSVSCVQPGFPRSGSAESADV